MKSTSVSTKIITILLLLAVIGYFAVQGYNYFVSPETTTLVYRYHSERSIALRGYVVRDEQVVDCNETLIELKHAEGERVGQGDTIASVYRSADALNATQQLETLRAQKEQLEYAKSASSDAATALRLDTDIREQIISVRAAYESGAYSSLDTLIPQLKTTVLKREYAYNGSDDLTAKLDELNAQITALSGAASGGTTRITAPVSGTYSAVADGYESVLTPEVLETMTPSQLSSAAPQSVSTTVGKLIQGSAWYFAANVNEEDAASLKENSRLTLRMASGVGFDLPVTLTRISAAENGKCLIVLKSTRYLSYMTLLREQNAELIITSDFLAISIQIQEASKRSNHRIMTISQGSTRMRKSYAAISLLDDIHQKITLGIWLNIARIRRIAIRHLPPDIGTYPILIQLLLSKEIIKRNLASQLSTLYRASHLIKLSIQVALVDILLHPSRIIEKFLHHSAIAGMLLGKLLLHHLSAHRILQAIQVSISLIHIVHIMLAGIVEDMKLRIHAKHLLQTILH